MKFTKLRLLGFKSFVEPMDFIIEAGLTGVVGPNGCGKSNLVEALRWVMGENSYKNMRASGMDDVIFAGSTHRPARNTAEVTVYLDNSDRSAPTAFNIADDLEVTRRIEREAGSAYKINGKDVRARDVQLLFADASTGARSPSLVGQGRIGEIISQKPTQRRGLLEEAAGISGLHSRRHEAELRLKAAETNLERLEDIMAQIAVQLDSLKRQARQASRYRNLSSDIRRTEATLYHVRWKEILTQEDAARVELRTADDAVNEASKVQAEAARTEAVANHALPQLRDDQAATGATVQRLTLAARELDNEELRLNEKLADLKRRADQIRADKAREQQLVDENATMLAGLDEEKAKLDLAEAETGSAMQAATTAQAEAEDVLQQAEQEANALTAQLAEAEGARRQMQQTIDSAKGRQQRLVKQSEEARRTLAQLEAQLEAQLAGDTGLETIRADLERAQDAFEALEAEAESVSQTLVDMREAEGEARRNRAEAEGAFNRLETEAKTLARVLSAGRDDRFPPMLDSLSVEAGFEVALAAALGDDLDAPMDAEAAIHWGESEMGDDDPALPHGLSSLADYVTGPNRLARRLGQIGLVAPGHGQALQKSLKPGQRLVSKEGDLWRWDGLMARAGAPTPAAQRLEQRNRLSDLEGRLEEARTALDAARARFGKQRDAVVDQTRKEQAARTAARDAQRKLSGLRDALTRAEREASQKQARKQSLQDSLARLNSEAEEAGAAVAEAVGALEALADMSAQRAALDAARAELGLKRSALAEARAHAQGLKREAELRQMRLEAIGRERQSWVTRAANANNQIAVLDARLGETEKERQTLADSPDTIAVRRRTLLSEITKAEEAQRVANDALTEAERAAMEAGLAAKTAMQALTTSREGRIRAEERVNAIKDRLRDIEARILEALDCTPSECFALAHLKEGAPLPALPAVETRLERLKNERERLGGVNLRADEEAAEIADQLSSMEKERDDLVEAIKKLRTGIFNLNKEARARLLAAFDVVNDHFKSLFAKLFGGGQAELKLTDAEDPLEAGLEIIARPPGKKPQTMTLLSGGEQALTAMALIFAVFLTNPAPICVLDEVDAPLDDANVERFCTLLEEMRSLTETRFVTITHNPITMARMDRLFGVTMAERGISQLVSVNLEAAEELVAEDNDKAIASVPPGHPRMKV